MCYTRHIWYMLRCYVFSIQAFIPYSTYAHIPRNSGRVDVRRVGAPYAPHFAWFLDGFCMNIETCHFDMFVFCTVLHGFCMWNSLFFSHVEHIFLHHTNSFFCITRTACFLHGFCMTCVAQPRASPLFFFLSGCRVGSSWRTWRRALVTKCAERAPR